MFIQYSVDGGSLKVRVCSVLLTGYTNWQENRESQANWNPSSLSLISQKTVSYFYIKDRKHCQKTTALSYFNSIGLCTAVRSYSSSFLVPAKTENVRTESIKHFHKRGIKIKMVQMHVLTPFFFLQTTPSCCPAPQSMTSGVSLRLFWGQRLCPPPLWTESNLCCAVLNCDQFFEGFHDGSE